MAEFCKEYCINYDSDLDYSFSIQEEFDRLENDHYTNIICEGYGFVGILKSHYKCKLLFPTKGEFLDIVDLEKLDDYYKKNKI